MAPQAPHRVRGQNACAPLRCSYKTYRLKGWAETYVILGAAPPLVKAPTDRNLRSGWAMRLFFRYGDGYHRNRYGLSTAVGRH